MAFMAAALPYLALAGSAVSAVGAYQQGQQQQSADNFNASVMNQRAVQSQEASGVQAQIVGQQNEQKIGATEAAYGAGGVMMSGTPLEVMSSQAVTGELNRRLTLYQGQVASTSDRNQAAVDTTQGQAAAQAGLLKAGTSLLTGGLTFAQSQLNGSGPGSITPLAAAQNPFAGGGSGAGGMT